MPKQAITIGVEEEIYLRKFSLYSWGNKYGKDVDKLDKPQKAVKTQMINYNTANIRCQHCNEESHYEKECIAPWSEINKGNDFPQYQQHKHPQ